MKVSIAISNRHVHLTQKHFNILFGEDCILEKKNDLSQPGQFASTLKVTIKTDKASIENVRIVGPIRSYTQVEISKTDAYKLGINPPVRDSGDLIGSEGITIVGPKGEIHIKEGCILASRHIHLMPSQIELYGLKGKDTVSVLLNGEKGGRIDNVHLKVSEKAYFELHLDTDDANAHLINNNDIGEII